jgi:hypothetical protein
MTDPETARSRDSAALLALLARGVSPGSPGDAATWERIAELAERCDLAPLLAARLKHWAIDAPPQVCSSLRGSYRASLARSMAQGHELGRALSALAAEGIRTIVLKGAYLAEAIYHDAAARPMSDVDLLVAEENLGRAISALRIHGFGATASAESTDKVLSRPHVPPMVTPAGTVVELHWTIVEPGLRSNFTRDDLDGLWNRALPCRIAGMAALALEPTDQLLHLCLHTSSQHRFDGQALRQLVDIAEVGTQLGGAIDWEAFTQRANRWRVANAVLLTLLLVRELVGPACPDAVLDRLEAEPMDDTALAWARRKVLQADSRLLDSDVTRFATARSLGEKFATVRAAVFPSRVALARLYNASPTSWRVIGYYPARWKYLCERYFGAVTRILRRDRTLLEDARREARLRAYVGWH